MKAAKARAAGLVKEVSPKNYIFKPPLTTLTSYWNQPPAVNQSTSLKSKICDHLRNLPNIIYELLSKVRAFVFIGGTAVLCDHDVVCSPDAQMSANPSVGNCGRPKKFKFQMSTTQKNNQQIQVTFRNSEQFWISKFRKILTSKTPKNSKLQNYKFQK